MNSYLFVSVFDMTKSMAKVVAMVACFVAIKMGLGYDIGSSVPKMKNSGICSRLTGPIRDFHPIHSKP